MKKKIWDTVPYLTAVAEPPDFKMISDEELMLFYQKGNSSAFEELFSRYQKEIYNFICRFLGDVEGASEAFQEVFERVIRSGASYSPKAKFSTWVYTIARNYCIDLFRKKKLRRVVSLDEPGYLDDDGLTLGDRLSDKGPLPDEEISAMDLGQKLVFALNHINPDQREVFLLRERQGLQFEEISKIIGVSLNTVKSRMRYALKALQGEFKKMGITDPK